ncbi:Hypothetical protein NTJ_05708 [Nesidiocoris tenuis]|uniref:DUF4794 domain-containing protein n=1 Tax=Nesidiocoris tenuis TaxID=355587 RepID=A0ABN7ANA2_9HEMI|nr:Hypothetical protein NTJ_05708 [Nesidiocoris tenuis]
MIGSLLLLLGAGSSMATGGLVQMPYPNPAGVTYTTHAAAVPAVPTHLHYADTSSSVAYGNAAFLKQALAPAAIQYAAPVAQYAAAPVAHYAAPVVPTVHHVPAVAQVPVTKYEAQPAVIQNLVDVAKPKLASSKIEIRRPAIQKEFYDVEERVIIRPAGSAVVELDQPVSKNQRGPTLVQPAVHAVSAHPLVGFRSLHSHAISNAYPASFSVHQYPFQGPAAIPVASSPLHHQELVQQPQEYPQEPQQEQQQPQEQQPEQEQLPQQELQQLPQQELQQAPQQEVPQPPQQQLPQFPQQEPQQFDDSDSVAIDNPDIARVRSQQQQAPSVQQQPQQLPQQPLFRNFPQRPSLFAPQQQLLSQLREMVQQRASSQQQLIARSQLQAQENVVAQLEAQTQAQQDQLARTQQILQLQQQELARSRLASASLSRSQPGPQQPQQQPAPAARSQQNTPETGLSSVGPEPQQRTAAPLSSSDLRNSLIDSIARSSPSPSVIPSFRISAEQSLANQERFIDLLTGRGGVVEARTANGQPSSEPSQVRARVLSVTPAPDNAAPREEKVNTRRIVVSRPIQTLEEVDVVQPFTKIERVAVHSPAVIKTAHHGVAHLPTSVPVHGYAAAIPAYK